jgi:hypothetical protein
MLTLPFADGEYTFALKLPQLLELERATGDTSILTLEQRLNAAIGLDGEEAVFIGGGAAMITDVREIIRLALMGGGSAVTDAGEIEIGPVRAKQLVDAYVCPARPLDEGIVLAWRILSAVIYGVRLQKKKSDADDESPNRSEKGR